MPQLQSGSKFRTEVVAFSTTNKTNVYTVPANFSSHLENLMVSNLHSSAVNLSLHLFHAEDNTEYTLLTTYPVAANSYESIFTLDKPLYLHAGDIIKCTAGTADKLVVTTSCEEFFDAARRA
tara:strand:+ start:405 stop:770 length:366 start_codon:yes stop_codon:yes gene_type:complete